MIIEHLGKRPRIHPSAYIAPTATLCGAVTVGANTRILHGAAVIAEGGRIDLGDTCIVLENAVIRSTERHSVSIGRDTLIGPHAHIVGCMMEESVCIATGASVFHGASLGARSEVRINGVVHVKSSLPADATVPIGWVAVGDPASILPPDEHEKIWQIQKDLDFPKVVYGVERAADGAMGMPEITSRLAEIYESHRDDIIVD